MKYLISQNGTVHGFLVSDRFDKKEDAETKLGEYKKIDITNEYDEKIHEVLVESIKADGVGVDESDSTVTVKVTAKIDGEKHEAKFHVQTIDGRYNTQSGCWILTDCGGGDMNFNKIETLVFEASNVTETAESYFNG